MCSYEYFPTQRKDTETVKCYNVYDYGCDIGIHTDTHTPHYRNTQFISRILAYYIFYIRYGVVCRYEMGNIYECSPYLLQVYLCEKATHFPFMFTNLFINLLYITWLASNTHPQCIWYTCAVSMQAYGVCMRISVWVMSQPERFRVTI